MIKMKVSETDFSKNFNDILKNFAGDGVLVGVPAEDSDRKNAEKEPITNAALLAINEYGSPANNIPSRPVLTIGLRNAKDAIAEELKKAAQGFFDGSGAKYFERAGIVATSAIKQAINEQDSIEGPSAATLAARAAKGFKGTKSLIVTGQLRNSITYVLTDLWAGIRAYQKNPKFTVWK